MVTIRNIINKAIEIEAEMLNKTKDYVFNKCSLSFIFFTKNNIRIFIDMNSNYFPTKNKTYRKISFDIEGNLNCNMNDEIKKYATYYLKKDGYYYERISFSDVPERLMNEFLLDNGGVDIDKFEKGNREHWRNIMVS